MNYQPVNEQPTFKNQESKINVRLSRMVQPILNELCQLIHQKGKVFDGINEFHLTFLDDVIHSYIELLASEQEGDSLNCFIENVSTRMKQTHPHNKIVEDERFLRLLEEMFNLQKEIGSLSDVIDYGQDHHPTLKIDLKQFLNAKLASKVLVVSNRIAEQKDLPFTLPLVSQEANINGYFESKQRQEVKSILEIHENNFKNFKQKYTRHDGEINNPNPLRITLLGRVSRIIDDVIDQLTQMSNRIANFNGNHLQAERMNHDNVPRP